MLDDIPHLAVDHSEVGAAQWSSPVEEVLPSRTVLHVQCAGRC